MLEVACGTGIATEALRHALEPNVALVATDVNADMLDFARRKLSDANVQWEIADGANLPFDAETLDLLVCQFGYMFVRDKGSAFREARRVLTASGALLFNVWGSLDENPYARVVHETLAGAFGVDSQRLHNAPFGYHDESRIRADLAAAGFVDVEVEAVPSVGEASSAAELSTGSVFGSPVYHAIAERGLDHRAIEVGLARRLARLGGDAPFRAPLLARVVTARR